MFSGIVEEMATVRAIKREGGNIDLTLSCSFTQQLKIDQSISHNGVCLTVVNIDGDCYTVTAMKETLDRSNLGQLNAWACATPTAALISPSAIRSTKRWPAAAISPLTRGR